MEPAINLDNFPSTLCAFKRRFPSEPACEAYLFAQPYPVGFVCRACGSTGEPWRIGSKHCLLECRDCGQQRSLTSDTVFETTKEAFERPVLGAVRNRYP